MSTPLFPLAVWQSGTNENSIPANDNALRVQVLMAPAIDVADSEPGSPSEDDIHVIGTPWGGFTENNVVIYKGGVWLEWEAFEGWGKVIDGQQHYFDGADWILGGGGSGIPDAPSDGRLYGRKDAAWEEVTGGGGGGGITSPTISRIITSTDPDEPLSPGDLLVVLPRPRVIASAHSPQTYGDGDSVISVDVTVPLEAKEGDMLLLLVSSADTVVTPGGFSLVRTQDSVRDVSPTGLGRTTVFSMNAGSNSAGSTITVAQGSSGRMAAVLVVARGEGISIADSGSEQFSEPSVNTEFPHPIPSLTATAQGQMAVCAMSCALAANSGYTEVTWPTGWAPITPTSVPDNPSHERLRSWAAYRYLQAGESTAESCLHSVGNHDGSSVTIILECA